MPRSSNTAKSSKAHRNDDKDKKSIQAILKQAITPNSKPTEATFPELPSVIFWMRAILGASLGCYLGTHQVVGAAVLMQCLNFLSFVPVIYVYLFLGVKTNSEEFGGIWKMLWSGMAPAMALCVLVWIYILTATQEKQVELLNGMLVNDTMSETSAIESDGDRISGLDGSETKQEL